MSQPRTATAPAASDPRLGALLAGSLGAARRHWRLALALYLPNLLLGVALALPAHAAASGAASLGPWVARMLEGDHLEVLVEAAIATQTAAELGGDHTALDLATLGAPLLLSVLLAPLAVIVQGLIYTFVAGGVISGLAASPVPSSPMPTSPRHPERSQGSVPPSPGPARAPSARPGAGGFWRACRHWFWPMLLLGLLAMPLFGVFVAVGAAVLGMAAAGADEPWSFALWTALWLSIANGLLELARANVVVWGRGALHALGRAFALFGRRRLVSAALLLWALLGLLGALHVGLGTLLVASVPASSVLPAFLVQQVVAFLGAWLKLLRLAAATRLALAAS